MKVLITGATGFVGSQLVRKLASTPEVTEIRVVSRSPEQAEKRLAKLTASTPLRAFKWNAEKEIAPAKALDGIDAVIHLAGENIAGGRWTPEVKRRILDSRKLGTKNLVDAINRLEKPPIFLSTSAVGIYGTRGDEVLTEKSAPGAGFLVDVCKEWEAEAKKAKVSRLAIFRLGVVLGDGGMLERILPIFKAGLGGKIGDGNHWFSWIAVTDLVDLLTLALIDKKFVGTLNAVAPEPVRNETFTHTLGEVLHRPTFIPAPAFALKLAFGQMAEEALLASQRVSPEKLMELGYSFGHPTLKGALTDFIESRPGS